MKYRKSVGILTAIISLIIILLLVVALFSLKSATSLAFGKLTGKVLNYSISNILTIIVIARCASLSHRDTKMALVNAGYLISGFMILFSLVTLIFSINVPELANYIIYAFECLIIIFTFIFEINANNMFITILQYITSAIISIGAVIIGYNVVKGTSNIDTMSVIMTGDISSITLINPIILLVIGFLLLFLIPIINSLFDEEIKESNILDEIQQSKNIAAQNNNTAPVNNVQKPNAMNTQINTQTATPTPPPVQPTEKIENASIPIISTPVTINKDESNNN